MSHKRLKNNRGMALVLVIVVMAVTSILITSVLALSLSDTKLAVNQENRLQAQYIARAGADASAKYVQDHSGEFDPGVFINKSIANTDLGEGSFSAEITKPFNGSIIVQSTGVVSGLSEQVSISLAKGDYSGLFKGIRQTGFSPMDLGAMNITYEAGATVDIEGNVQDLSEISLNSTNAADPNITTNINNDSSGDIILPTGYASYPYTAIMDGDNTITGNSRIGTLSKGNNQTITFDTNGTTQNIVVDNLDIQGPDGTMDIIGDGVVNLYILNSGKINTPVNANTGAPSELFIYVADGVILELQSNCKLSAYIYAPNATIEIQSDQTTVTGAMIGNILQRNSTENGAHGNFHFVPLPDDTDYSGILYYVRRYYSN